MFSDPFSAAASSGIMNLQKISRVSTGNHLF
jgi:hypothetical protein